MVDEKIFVKYYLKTPEHRYYVLDWSFEDPTVSFCKYEEVPVTQGLIEEMVEINPENIEFLGFFSSEKDLEEGLKELKEEDFLDYTIEYYGPGYYVVWGEVVVEALEALEVEYDLAWDSGVWASWLIGRSKNDIGQPKDIITILQELYGPYDDETTTFVENFVKEVIGRKFQMSDDIYYYPIIEEVFEKTPMVGRIDPARLP